MPPPEEPMPLPLPKPKPPKPKPPKPEPNLEPKPRPEWDQPDRIACAADCSESCAYYRLCPPPPPSRAPTVHPRSSRLPTPLVALSASLLAVSVVLLITLLVRRMVRRQRQRRRQTAPQEAPLTHHDEEGVPVPAVAVAVAVEGEDADDGGVHHVWSIRTVGLDERAIAAITTLVYDAKKFGCGVGLGGGGDDGRCAVCLAEFRDGETLRLLPRCGHAFHRGCIDTWLRAHVNCPLCRAPVQAAGTNAAPGAATAAPGGEPAANHRAAGGAGTEEADRDGALPEHAVRRAASMVALPRRAWPDVSLRAPASNSGLEGVMGLAKISRLLKLSR